jgi:membrane dipeptidase
VKLLPFGVVLPAQMFSSFSSMASASNSDNQKLSGDINSSFLQTGIDEIYNKAIVIDGLIIGRNWDQDSFEAMDQSGYTGFNISVGSGGLAKALTSLESQPLSTRHEC